MLIKLYKIPISIELQYRVILWCTKFQSVTPRVSKSDSPIKYRKCFAVM